MPNVGCCRPKARLRRPATWCRCATASGSKGQLIELCVVRRRGEVGSWGPGAKPIYITRADRRMGPRFVERKAKCIRHRLERHPTGPYCGPLYTAWRNEQEGAWNGCGSQSAGELDPYVGRSRQRGGPWSGEASAASVTGCGRSGACCARPLPVRISCAQWRNYRRSPPGTESFGSARSVRDPSIAT